MIWSGLTTFSLVTILGIFATSSLAQQVSQNQDLCVDYSSDCAKYGNECSNYKVLLQICPITCNNCPKNPCRQSNRGGCSDVCTWTEGSKVTCRCFPGFKLDKDNKTCIDIDECSEGPDPCPSTPDQPQYCHNIKGSHVCLPSSSCNFNNQSTSNYYRSPKCCALKNDTCGTNVDIRSKFNPEVESRIFGGTPSVTAAWPWMVQVVDKDGSHVCGGTIISKSFVLTSANCFNHTDSHSSWTLIFGHVTLGSSRLVRRSVEQVIRHDSLEHDIALIRLNEPLQFNDVISPVCLPCGEVPKVGQKCWATGFGLTGEGANITFPPTLREVDLPIVDAEKCARSFSDVNVTLNKKTMTCAGYVAGGKDACFGDGGGPLVCQRETSCSWYVTGVTSFGRGCGRAGFYGVYTNVARFEDWIRANVGEEKLCPANYNPCAGLTDTSSGCRSNADACAPRMKEGCVRTCCLRKHGRVPACFDRPGFSGSCQVFRSRCNSPLIRDYMRTNCARTCGAC